MSGDDGSAEPRGARSSAARDWDRAHAAGPAAGGVPSRLFTDENPATTIKGTGFKNREVAERTLRLTSQPGARYKQYWTVRAMRERAARHPHPTDGMRDAIAVFDGWLDNYRDPTAEERRVQEEEWREFRRLCDSVANRHAYGNTATQEELARARRDARDGRRLLADLLSAGLRSSKRGESGLHFPITSFTALFGGPGLHGYGEHTATDRTGDDGAAAQCESSRIEIGAEGVGELIGRPRAAELGLVPGANVSITVCYDRSGETATVRVKRGSSGLENLWKKGAQKDAADTRNGDVRPRTTPRKQAAVVAAMYAEQKSDSHEVSWACSICTFLHEGKAKESYLACELCGSERTGGRPTSTCNAKKASSVPVPTMSTSPAAASPPTWGCLRAPSQRDIVGPRKRRKGLEKPPPTMDYLVVLDFEWTADDKRKMKPIAEITQFPSVVMKLLGSSKKGESGDQSAALKSAGDPDASSRYILTDISSDLRPSPTETSPKRDAICVSMFDTFVRPTLNPKLTKFSVELTGIEQGKVDCAPTIDRVIVEYMKWLQSVDLVDAEGRRVGNWAFATWGDVDLMTTLRLELQHKSIDRPLCFDRWINLKDDAIYRRHYCREPRGGLRACVESTGATWEGRAHNGLADSVNTAKIVRDMVRTGFRFTRPTRGLGRDGVPFGQVQKG